MGLTLQTKQFYDNSGGMDLKRSPTKVDEDRASFSRNIRYSTDGAFFTRNGSSIANISGGIPAQIAGAPRVLALFDYKHSNGTEVQIVCAGTAIYHSLTSPTSQVTGLSGSLPIPCLEFMNTSYDEFVFYGNGIDTNRKFNGSSWTNWSLPTPAAPSPADNGAGALGAGDYDYYYAHAVIVSGVIVMHGALSPVGSVTIGASRQIMVSSIAVSADTQVNARILYRKSPTSLGKIFRHATINDNVTTTYDDNTAADGTIEADFDISPTPTTSIFSECFDRMFFRKESEKSVLGYTAKDQPWNAPIENEILLDAEITCIKRIFGILIVGTRKSIWIQPIDPEEIDPRRVSSTIGILNNRCAVGESFLYFLGTNLSVYKIRATDFSQDELRLDKSLSYEINPFMGSISKSNLSKVCMEYYTKDEIAQVQISCPVSSSDNDNIAVYDETQSLAIKKSCWSIDDNINASTLKVFNISGDIRLYSGDFNGFIWRLDDPFTHGDGSEENGTVTSSTSTTLTDSGQSWTVNEHVGKRVRVISGTGVDQVRTVISNTSTQLTVSTWATNPGVGAEFTVGGYDTVHFTNWKKVLSNYDIVKQLAYLYFNANASGNYNLTIILQFNYDTADTNQTEILFNLSAENTIWGAFLWGFAPWGARSVFQDTVRKFARFKSMRIGFKIRKAGQPFQINGFGIGASDLGYLEAA